MLIFSVFPLILLSAFIGLFIFTIYLILGSGKRYERLKNEISPEFLNYTRLGLLHWEEKKALLDMSSEVRRTTVSSFFGGNWSHAKGTIRSLNDSGEKWLVFTLNLYGRKGKLDLHTSSMRFLLEYENCLGKFLVDGQVFGFINTANDLMNQDQQVIGRIHSMRKFTPMGLGVITPVEIYGRTVAEIHYLSDFGDRLWKAPGLVSGMTQDISNVETIWIVAVIATRLYSYCKNSKTV